MVRSAWYLDPGHAEGTRLGAAGKGGQGTPFRRPRPLFWTLQYELTYPFFGIMRLLDRAHCYHYVVVLEAVAKVLVLAQFWLVAVIVTVP